MSIFLMPSILLYPGEGGTSLWGKTGMCARFGLFLAPKFLDWDILLLENFCDWGIFSLGIFWD